MRLAEIQQALREEGLDGWLFFDHHVRDPLAYRVLQFHPERLVSRRWYYLIPAEGEPRSLAHRVEPTMLDSLPGTKAHYSGWAEQANALRTLLGPCRKVAMQYSPNCAVPYVANVDAGTVELIRGLGVEVVTSANLVQTFEATWSQAAYESHKAAGVKVDAIRSAAFQHAAEAVRAGRTITEHEVQQFITSQFNANGLVYDHSPIVGVNGNASNPHYEPTAEHSSPIRKGDSLLIDLWAKLAAPHSVYYDITWVGFLGESVPDPIHNVFTIVRDARRAAFAEVKSAAEAGRPLMGFQVDDVSRGHIQSQGFGQYFVHRTGHSIGEEVHGNGANIDNLETHDERLIAPRTCFSLEPGIYLPEFGIRSEVNVYRSEHSAEVTGEEQDRVLALFA